MIAGTFLNFLILSEHAYGQAAVATNTISVSASRIIRQISAICGWHADRLGEIEKFRGGIKLMDCDLPVPFITSTDEIELDDEGNPVHLSLLAKLRALAQLRPDARDFLEFDSEGGLSEAEYDNFIDAVNLTLFWTIPDQIRVACNTILEKMKWLGTEVKFFEIDLFDEIEFCPQFFCQICGAPYEEAPTKQKCVCGAGKGQLEKML